MYYDNPEFQTPADDAKIWRFMDFTKFVYLVDKNSLYFARVDKFEDAWEGAITKPMSQLRNNWVNRLHPYISNQFKKSFNLKKKPMAYQFTYLNCWHINEYESAAMWKIYADINYGVAIQSTFERLCGSFQNYPNQVQIGKVEYIDYNNATVNMNNFLKLYLSKRKSFEYENELRAIIVIPPTNANWEYPEGINVNIDINKLIEKIYICPKTEDWFLDLVKSITKKYNLDKEIIRSSLADGPIY